MPLTLTNIRPILSLPPLHGDPCQSTLYAPCLVPQIGVYAMGSHLDNGSDQAWGSDKRQSDRIWMSVPVGPPVQAFDNKIFPWMSNPEEWLQSHPESYVGSVGSPSVIPFDGRYLMAFTASINDPNVCCGEHGAPNQYGSCQQPWSYFAMYWATSDDGNVWTLERDPWRIPAQLDASTSMALDNSAIHYYPAPSDMDLTSSLGGCKGVTFTNLIDGNDNYLYCFLELWTTDPVLLIKQVAVRVKTDLSQRAGHNFNFEIYDTPYQTWRPVREGRLPRWIETDGWRGAVFASGLSRVCAWPHGFIALSAPGGAMTAQLTPSLPAGWTAAVPVSGSPSGVLQPQPVYTADGLHAVWAAKDSACSASAPYYGLQIWQGDLALT